MKKLSPLIIKSAIAMAGLVMIIFLAMGCSNFDSPTVSQSTDSGLDLWNPQPGDQIIPGRDIPILNDGYWGSGLQINDGASVASASAEIGPNGGTLCLGAHTLIIPPGAVNRPIIFTMSYASLTAVAVDCSPSPFHFNVPVQLKLSYANTQYEGDDAQENLEVFFMSSTLSCTPMPSRVDEATETVIAELDHFSRYIIS